MDIIDKDRWKITEVLSCIFVNWVEIFFKKFSRDISVALLAIRYRIYVLVERYLIMHKDHWKFVFRSVLQYWKFQNIDKRSMNLFELTNRRSDLQKWQVICDTYRCIVEFCQIRSHRTVICIGFFCCWIINFQNWKGVFKWISSRAAREPFSLPVTCLGDLLKII